VLSEARRRDVLAAVAEARAFMIEDDWARDLHLGGKAAPPPVASHDVDGHVVYIRSLTKPAAPGLRVAALCARGAAFARLRSTRNADDFFVAGPLQEAALQLVSSPAWPRHLRAVRAALRERRDALAAAVRDGFGPHALSLVPEGGLHLWVRLPDGVSDADVAARAARANVIVGVGRGWFAAEPPGPLPAPHLRRRPAGHTASRRRDLGGDRRCRPATLTPCVTSACLRQSGHRQDECDSAASDRPMQKSSGRQLLAGIFSSPRVGLRRPKCSPLSGLRR
jgi:DNA-binding transcriptional MocR family regulator